ncbi:hypothetical protein MNV49_002721 [Pseudohyphozyma bogoriensis]|nr:hypothetical protein MNV49_002721 [Pseudohyphozyma bogoriensis]
MLSFTTLALAALLSVSAVDASRGAHGNHHARRVPVKPAPQWIKRFKRDNATIGFDSSLATVAANTTAFSNSTLTNATAATEWYNATAMWFSETGAQTACYTSATNADLMVGLSTLFWNNTGVVSDYCGQYLLIKNPATNATVTALISDASGNENLIMTQATFAAIADLEAGMVTVEYSFVNSTANATAAAVNLASSSSSSAASTAVATTTQAPVTTQAPASASYDQASADSAAAYSASSSKAAAAYASSEAAAYASSSQAAAYAASQSAAASKNAANAAASSSKAAAYAAESSSQAAAAAYSSSKAAAAAAKASATAAAAASSSASSSSSSSSSSKTYTGGYATYFTQNGVAGNCGTVHQDSGKGIALYTSTYDNGAYCGKNIVITRTDTGASVTATVWDSCPTCVNANSLDLSVGAFTAIATEEEGMVPITWQWA